MSRKLDNTRLADTFLKRSAKLLPCQREMAKWWYDNTDTSINQIARIFKVNKRTVQFILFPERLQKVKEHRDARGGTKIYYNKDKHTEAMNRHRKYKRKLYEKFPDTFEQLNTSSTADDSSHETSQHQGQDSGV